MKRPALAGLRRKLWPIEIVVYGALAISLLALAGVYFRSEQMWNKACALSILAQLGPDVDDPRYWSGPPSKRGAAMDRASSIPACSGRNVRIVVSKHEWLYVRVGKWIAPVELRGYVGPRAKGATVGHAT